SAPVRRLFRPTASGRPSRPATAARSPAPTRSERAVLTLLPAILVGGPFKARPFGIPLASALPALSASATPSPSLTDEAQPCRFWPDRVHGPVPRLHRRGDVPGQLPGQLCRDPPGAEAQQQLLQLRRLDHAELHVRVWLLVPPDRAAATGAGRGRGVP